MRALATIKALRAIRQITMAVSPGTHPVAAVSFIMAAQEALGETLDTIREELDSAQEGTR